MTDQKMKNYGTIAAILSVLIGIYGTFGPTPSFAVGVAVIVIGMLCAIFAVIKGETGAKILGAIGFIIGLIPLMTLMALSSL